MKKGTWVVPRVIRVCPGCGSTFYVREKEKKRFCSEKCSGNYLARRIYENDSNTPVMIEMYNSGKSARYIASQLGCSRDTVVRRLEASGIHVEHRHASGKDHYKWKGGKMNHSGYLLVKNPNYPESGNYYVRQHRLVWEQAYGPLPDGYEVHHLNGVRTDNRLENLCALPKSNHGKVNIKQDFIRHLQKRIRYLENQLKQLPLNMEGG